jgi:lipoprotein-anchoring transpeptidase ErfK/SrfK
MTGQHQPPPKPRYARLLLVAAAVLVTTVSVLGGVGTLPTAADPGPRRVAPQPQDAALTQPAPVVTPGPGVEQQGGVTALDSSLTDLTLPLDSGEGRRVVFSEGRQRVWLVADSGAVQRTYPVSGSLYDNLEPGSYTVYSRSGHATGVDDSGSMRWFVRFAQGDTGAAIGFHDIPVDDGAKVQSVAELGTPTSHGCIRQRTRDALAMWEFAPIGTTVVVTA